jgi:spore photoproduct lyase
MQQLELLEHDPMCPLPTAYSPAPPHGFQVERIILAKGSLDTPEREAFVRRICGVYPGVPVEEWLGVAHNRVELDEPDPVRRVAKGKRTLVFGVIDPKHALWGDDETNAYYENRRRLSLYSFCFYDCRFCYLSGRSGVWHSPAIRIYVNFPEILAEVDRLARAAVKTIEFCPGGLQDGLSLDPLTSYASVLIPLFADYRYARLNFLTKSVDIEALLGLEHGGNTTLGWTLNPPEIARHYECKAPPVEKRMEAMRRCATAGYPIQASIMPVIPQGHWKKGYLDFVAELLDSVHLERLTLGGASLDSRTRMLLERRMGQDNVISRHLCQCSHGKDGKTFYPYELCRDLFRETVDLARRVQPGLTVDVAIP